MRIVMFQTGDRRAKSSFPSIIGECYKIVVADATRPAFQDGIGAAGRPP
jgi:hypothetical protein